MSRYDKYGPKTGGFRAPSNIAWAYTAPVAGVEQAANDVFRVCGVALNGTGRVIKAASAITAVGIVVVHGPKNAGEILDIMTSGEVIELGTGDIQGLTAPTAGTKYYLDFTTGRLTATAPGAGVNSFYVGTTVEAGRLVVRTGLVQG